MRLINADLLIAYLEEELALKYTGHLSDDVVCGMISRQNEIIQFIKAQPITFDVEAVVKELENKKSHEGSLANSDGTLRHMHLYAKVCFGVAIDIIRKGSVENE